MREYLRKRHIRDLSLDGLIEGEIEPLAASAFVSGDDHSVDDGTNAVSQQLSPLYEALKALPEKPRRLIEWHYFDGKSYEDIAKLLSMKLGAVRVASMRARTLLQKRLLQRGFGEI